MTYALYIFAVLCMALVSLDALTRLVAALGLTRRDRDYRSLRARLGTDEPEVLGGALSELAGLELSVGDLVTLQRFGSELSEVDPSKGLMIVQASIELRLRREYDKNIQHTDPTRPDPTDPEETHADLKLTALGRRILALRTQNGGARV